AETPVELVALVDHHDGGHALLRIDHELGAGSPAPIVIAGRAWPGMAAWVEAHGETEAEAAPRSEEQVAERRVAGNVAEVILGHVRDRAGTEQPGAVEDAAVEHHL